jgi:hypothetical protein
MEELEVDVGFDKMTYGSAHYKWTSLNLQLRRVTDFKGLCLRDSITLSDVRFRPDEIAAWFGNTPFEHPFSHNTPHQPHPELEC